MIVGAPTRDGAATQQTIIDTQPVPHERMSSDEGAAGEPAKKAGRGARRDVG
jgi:hypothetical protein